MWERQAHASQSSHVPQTFSYLKHKPDPCYVMTLKLNAWTKRLLMEHLKLFMVLSRSGLYPDFNLRELLTLEQHILFKYNSIFFL